MKKLLVTTALVLSIAGSAFADQADNTVKDNNLNTNSNNGAISQVDSNNQTVKGDNTEVSGGTYVNNNAGQANGYISNPSLTTSGADTCFGSSSGGISAAGFGISGGSTVVDENCVTLKNVKLLTSLGLKDAAIAYYMERDPTIAKALSQAYPQIVLKLLGVQDGTTINN